MPAGGPGGGMGDGRHGLLIRPDRSRRGGPRATAALFVCQAARSPSSEAPVSAPPIPRRSRANSSRPMPWSLADRSAVASVARGPRRRARPAPPACRPRHPAARCRRRAPAPAGRLDRLGREMDRRRHLARGAGHPPVGDQRHLEAPVLQHPQRRRQLVQLGHAVGLRALEAHHGDQVALELAGLERGEQPSCSVKITAGASIRRCSGLTAEILITPRPRLPLSSFRPPSGENGSLGRAHDRRVTAGSVAACSQTRRPPSSRRPLPVALEPALAGHGQHVGVDQAGVEQLADHERHAARGLELVHVGQAVGIDAGEQRRRRRDLGEVVPVQEDAGRARHRHQMQHVVGRASGGHQADHGVDERALVEHAADRRKGVAQGRISATRWVAARVSASRSGVFGLTNAAPGTCRPMISISIWLELAVP